MNLAMLVFELLLLIAIFRIDKQGLTRVEWLLVLIIVAVLALALPIPDL
jgi:competence protein ComGC